MKYVVWLCTGCMEYQITKKRNLKFTREDDIGTYIKKPYLKCTHCKKKIPVWVKFENIETRKVTVGYNPMIVSVNDNKIDAFRNYLKMRDFDDKTIDILLKDEV